VVIDFIDMVLESNRELVLRRLTECLGRDRTKHQVTEITSLGLVQMTRKRIGQGLLEAFSETCEHCKGRGVVVHMEPVSEPRRTAAVKAVAAVAAAPVEGTGRRRRRSTAVVLDEAEDELGTVAPAQLALVPGLDAIDDESNGVEGDEQGLAEGRRRTRRGGRRRTR
jgi:ribonuclease E